MLSFEDKIVINPRGNERFSTGRVKRRTLDEFFANAVYKPI